MNEVRCVDVDVDDDADDDGGATPMLARARVAAAEADG